MSKISKIFLGLVLILGAIISVFPFYWMFVLSSIPNSEVFAIPPKLTFGNELVQNIQTVFEETSFFNAMKNTIFVATTTTIFVCFFSALAGFAFAKLNFRGKRVLFLILIATMMIPTQMNVIPLYNIMDTFGWVGTFKALIVPSLVNAFGIIWIKSFTEDAIPDSLLESATIDGSTIFQSFVFIVVPIIRPAIAFLALYTFMGSWNDYMWPLIISTDESKYTLMLALTQLRGLYSTNYPLVITGSLLATLPLLIIFLLFSKQLISGITEGAVK